MLVSEPIRTHLFRCEITCLVCKRKQVFEHDIISGVNFPVQPFCCDIMRNSDTPEWNKYINEQLESATWKVHLSIVEPEYYNV